MGDQRKPLTRKEIKLVEGIANGKTRRRAALDAYDSKSPSAAGVIASQALSKPNVKEALAEALEKHGITIDAATKPIADALKAEREDGSVDHTIRLSASRQAFNLMGINKNTAEVNITFHQHAEKQREVYDL